MVKKTSLKEGEIKCPNCGKIYELAKAQIIIFNDVQTKACPKCGAIPFSRNLFGASEADLEEEVVTDDEEVW